MRSWSIDDYLGRLGAPHPTPASAAVAALTLAQAAALLAMVVHVRDLGHEVLDRVGELREQALALAEADARAVEAVAGAYALPRSTDVERAHRSTAIADALLAAAGPPAEAVPIGAELISLCERLAGAASGAVLGDVAAAADAAAAALSISRTNVEVDAAPRRGVPEAQRLLAAVEPVDDLLHRAAGVRDRIRRTLA